MRHLFAGLLAAVAVAAIAAPAQAQFEENRGAGAGPLAGLRDDLPPAVRYLKAQGVTLTFLGDEGGMRGYLGESPTGRMQTFYVSPDGNHVVAGLLFRNGGVNVTGVQIGEMQSRFEKAMEESAASTGAGDLGGTAIPAATESPSAPSTASATTGSGSTVADSAGGYVSAAVAWLSDRDRAAFEAQAAEAAWFTVGLRDAPVLYMVVDPQCPFCHQAWERLRPLVIAKKLQIRIVMIAGLSGSEPLARSILAMPEPGKAWLDGQGSVRGVEVKPMAHSGSAEWMKGGQHLSRNTAFAGDLDVRGTPFLIYVGANGAVYESSGIPKDPTAFLSALR